ncbi:MAG: c-type cytochrome [Pseudomonadota bacterium]
MSDAPQSLPNDQPETAHEGPIKTPKQLITAVAFSFIVPIVVIVLLATFVTTATRPAAGSDGLEPEAVAQRIQRVGRVDIKDASAPVVLKTGEQVYAAQCSACHTAGLAGAPKLGDTAAWAPRIKTGYEALLRSALKGKGAMAPQGGGEHSDVEIGRAVVHLTNAAGAKFEEPKAPAPAASAATGTVAAAPAAPAMPAVVIPPPQAKPAATQVAAAPPLYEKACGTCHAAGVAGAPKLADKAAWAPRLALGIDGLTASVIKGKGVMPPRGGSQATDAEIKDVVTYMVGTVK